MKSDSVLKVGPGRGFVVEARIRAKAEGASEGRARYFKRRLILTAAHCLPHLPPAHAAANEVDRTYPQLVQTLDGKRKDVWAECLFVNPVADIAVLGSPDDQMVPDESERYDELAKNVAALKIGSPRSGPGWVLSLEGRWIRTLTKVLSGLHGTSLLIGPTKSGMSGSPILNDVGRVVGIVVIGTEINGQLSKLNGPQPILVRDLPRWLVDSLVLRRHV